MPDEDENHKGPETEIPKDDFATSNNAIEAELDETETNEDLPTPRASQYGRTTTDDDDNTPEAEDNSLTVDEDYFPPALPSRPPLDKTPSQLLSLQGNTGRPGTGSQLQAKATIAISLPEGVYATQHDGMGSAEGSGSVTAAPSFSDSTSIKSLVPTLTSGDNDLEEMLGEILAADEEERFGGGMETPEEMVYTTDDDAESEEEDESQMTEEEQLECWRSKRKHFFILSTAGKPIYSRYGTEAIFVNYAGVIQAIISFFADSDDTLQSITSGTHRFAVTCLGPLYLVAMSALPETPAQLKLQLDALYAQVVSTLTLSQLTKAFSGRFNFDLRRLLGGTDVFLNGLCDSMSRGEPSILLSALECLKLRKSHRTKLNNILLSTRAPELLYGLIIADSRLVSVIRPKRHSLHPPDLQLLFSMLFAAPTFRSDPGAEHWTPICLPKFNARGFLHAYIHFFRPSTAIVLISAQKDSFFSLRSMREAAVDQLTRQGLIPHIEAAIARFTPLDIVPGTPISHFLYKSRQNVQFVMPALPGGTVGRGKHWRRCMDDYQRMHAAVHTKGAHLKATYSLRRGVEALAWVTPAFELYVLAASHVPPPPADAELNLDGGAGADGAEAENGGAGEMGAAAGGKGKGGARAAYSKRQVLARGAQRIVGWMRQEEERLFILGGATF
ncbi:trafficking protein Mon1-domain-containing protein [Geopyxis carbonaria]|nr:trafficking protein Mon1-domain-containing protein [Geopyxis carbonaria]